MDGAIRERGKDFKGSKNPLGLHPRGAYPWSEPMVPREKGGGGKGKVKVDTGGMGKLPVDGRGRENSTNVQNTHTEESLTPSHQRTIKSCGWEQVWGANQKVMETVPLGCTSDKQWDIIPAVRTKKEKIHQQQTVREKVEMSG